MNRLKKYSFWALCVLLLLAGAEHFHAGDAGDKNLLLMNAHLLLMGKKFSTGIFEIDPPLILWLYTIPVYLHEHWGQLQDFQYLALIGLCTVALSIAVSLRLVRTCSLFAHHPKLQAWFVLLLASVFITVTNPTYFFDREHVLLVLAFPYLLSRAPSLYAQPRPNWLRVVIAVMAGIGFCIKPHTFIVFAGLQLLVGYRQRSWRILFATDNLIIYLMGACYLLLVWHVVPDYYTTVLPMALETYPAFTKRSGAVPYLLGALFTATVTLVDFRLRYQSPLRSDIYFFFALSLLWLLYALINGGWSYTYNPLISTLLIVNAMVLYEHFILMAQQEEQGITGGRFLQGIYACIANFIISILFTGIVITYSCGACVHFAKFADIIEREHIHSFGSMVQDFNVPADIYRVTGIMPSTRFGSMWMLTALFVSDDGTHKHQWVSDYIAHAMAEDLNHAQPEMMIIDNSPRLYQTHVKLDPVLYFSRYPDFAQAWKLYRFFTTVNFCVPAVQSGPDAESSCSYDVYKRATAAR